MISKENIRVKVTLSRSRYDLLKDYCSKNNVTTSHYIQCCVLNNLETETDKIMEKIKGIRQLNTNQSKRLAKYVVDN